MYCQKMDAHRFYPPDKNFCQECKQEGIERFKCDIWKKEYITGEELKNAFEKNCPRGKNPHVRNHCRNECDYYGMYNSGTDSFGESWESYDCMFTLEHYLEDIQQFRLLPDAIIIVEKIKSDIKNDVKNFEKELHDKIKKENQMISVLESLQGIESTKKIETPCQQRISNC